MIAFPSESERIIWVNAFSAFVQTKEQFEAEAESDSEPKMGIIGDSSPNYAQLFGVFMNFQSRLILNENSKLH